MMSLAYLYTQEGCAACGQARILLGGSGHEVREIPVDNPLLELGVKLLFRDGQLHTPVAVLPGCGIYILSQDPEPQLLRLISLEAEKEDSDDA